MTVEYYLIDTPVGFILQTSEGTKTTTLANRATKFSKEIAESLAPKFNGEVKLYDHKTQTAI